MTVNTTMGKITASKDTLNRLSIALYEAADSIQARKGRKNVTYTDTTPQLVKYT